MKYLIPFLLMITYCISAFADQRCDMDTQNCHISLDPNDDDTEIDVPAAKMKTIAVSRHLNADGVRVADGWYHGALKVPLNQGVLNPFLIEGESLYRKGADSQITDDRYVEATNTACNLTRTNFQENTGSDDQNQTEYTSNDWELAVKWKGYKGENKKEIPKFDMNDDDFDYNEDGVVDLSDFSLYRAKYYNRSIGIWEVEMHCRNGSAQ